LVVVIRSGAAFGFLSESLDRPASRHRHLAHRAPASAPCLEFVVHEFDLVASGPSAVKRTSTSDFIAMSGFHAR